MGNVNNVLNISNNATIDFSNMVLNFTTQTTTIDIESVIVNICSQFTDVVYNTWFWFIPFIAIKAICIVLKLFWNPTWYYKKEFEYRPKNKYLKKLWLNLGLNNIIWDENPLEFIIKTCDSVILIRVTFITVILFLQYNR